MGGGKDQKQANTQLKEQAAYQGQQQKAFDTRNTADLDASRGRANDLYGSLKGGYESLLNPATGQPIAGGAGGGGGGGGGGFVPPSVTDPRFGKVEDMYKNFMETGGWEDEAKKGQYERIGLMTDMGRTGGIAEADQARIRGGGVYDEFAKTGGYSDRDIANIRSRATAGIPSMYGRIKDESARLGSIQGGYGPGRAAMMSRLGRGAAADIGATSLAAETGIKENVNKGRQWGATGMTTSETGLQDMLTRNKMAGLTGASGATQSMQESLMGGKQWGTGGLHGMAEADRAAAERAAAMSASASAQGAANDRWEREFGLKQKMLGLEGLGGLYTSSPEEYMANKQFGLSSADVYGGQIGQGSMGLKTGNKSWADYAAPIAGAAAGGLTGGFSNFIPKPKAQGGYVDPNQFG